MYIVRQINGENSLHQYDFPIWYQNKFEINEQKIIEYQKLGEFNVMMQLTKRKGFHRISVSNIVNAPPCELNVDSCFFFFKCVNSCPR